MITGTSDQEGCHVFRPYAFVSLILASIVLSACSSAPKKSQPLPQQAILKLKAQPLSSQLPIPVQYVTANQLQDTWGNARSMGRRHEGIDILAPRGTKVTSATNGIVASLQGNRLGGNVVWILGPAGSWHYYAHLQRHKRGLHVGDYVRAGDVIGYVGNSGNARYTVTHLHYGIYLEGKGRGATNPYPYLRY
ncbi:M23 family metallopeptidase [Acinetobacter sp. MD2(2019)]|uniref:M23 family metallopeptidase n=1 Tax=Acinetobacter sp. MD2(2019) TaxID=2605273 RepID=UPI002D1E81D0|nr:M23 family metallopeptidase [Acinetobacter sp. MD2(2019)]MEB3754480.1 M23 family metallopeptidase [Acinetobacter sp. MD2(2019)]